MDPQAVADTCMVLRSMYAPLSPPVIAADLIEQQAARITELEEQFSDLAEAFNKLTDYGDGCGACWTIFRESGLATPCIGHSALAAHEAARKEPA